MTLESGDQKGDEALEQGVARSDGICLAHGGGGTKLPSRGLSLEREGQEGPGKPGDKTPPLGGPLPQPIMPAELQCEPPCPEGHSLRWPGSAPTREAVAEALTPSRLCLPD